MISFFVTGKKLMLSSDIPAVDLVSLCHKLQKRNKCSKNTSLNDSLKEVYFIQIVSISQVAVNLSFFLRRIFMFCRRFRSIRC